MSATGGSFSVGGGGTGSGGGNDFEYMILCDSHAGGTTRFLRTYRRDAAGVLTIADTYLNGATAYTVQGQVAPCGADASSETLLALCDSNAGVITPFLRRYTIDAAGTVTAVDTTLDGVTPYAVMGIVDLCAGDSRHEVLCDELGAFVRVYSGGSHQDYELDGITPYTPTGAVERCADSSDTASYILLCDDQTPACELDNRLVSGSWTITGNASDDGGDQLTFEQVAGSAPDGVAEQVATVTAGNTYAFSATLAKVGVAERTLIVTIDGKSRTYTGDSEILITVVAEGATLTVTITDASQGLAAEQAEVTGIGLYCIATAAPTATPFLRRVCANCEGSATSGDFALDGVTAYTVAGVVKRCDDLQIVNSWAVVLCDDRGAFLRRFVLYGNGLHAGDDYELDGITAYTPTGEVRTCTPEQRAVSTFVLCDDVGPFMRHIARGADGTITAVADTALDGITSYAVTGTVGRCMECQPIVVGTRCYDKAGAIGKLAVLVDCRGAVTYVDQVTGVEVSSPTIVNCEAAAILADCADVGSRKIAYGPNLLTNGDFALAVGIGATSAPTVGWTTAYAPTANIFLAGAATYAFFSTNAGQVTGNNAAAVPIAALGARSMAVNVGPNTAQAIISWANVYLENGKAYALGADAAIIFGPYGVAIRVDGVELLALVAPAVNGAWQKTETVFTWTGTTGYHTVSINSNNTAAGGNDHCFDNFSLRVAYPATTEVRTDISYSDTVRAVIDQVVETAGCKDDRRDTILAAIAQTLADSAAAGVTLECHMLNIVAGQTWTPANVPAGKTLTGLSYSVITGTVNVTDYDGTVVTGLPASYSGGWSAEPGGTLLPPQSIAAQVGGRAIISMTVK